MSLRKEKALLAKSPLFDAKWYLHRYPDVAEAGTDPIEHYLRLGAEEGRDPGPSFSTTAYLKSNPDVADSGINPLVHFLRHGRREGRKNKSVDGKEDTSTTLHPRTAVHLRFALKVQCRVLWALMLRETRTRYGRMRMGYLWALIEPMIFVGIFFVLFTLGGRTVVSNMPLMPFLITGASTFILFRDAMQTSIQAINSNKALLTFPQVTIFDLVLARVLLEIATHYTAAILLIIGVVWFTGPVEIENPFMVTVWFLCAGLLGFGGGLAFGALSALFPTVQQLVPAFILRPMFFISGIFFTVEIVPEGARDLALINPLLHITELVRSAFFIEFESAYAAPGYVILFLLNVIFLGLVTQVAFRQRILSLPG